MIDWLLNFFFVMLMLLALLLVVYVAIHKYFPTFGTVVMNVLAALPAFVMPFLDGLGGLPWSQILQPDHVGAVMFALAFANFIVRLNGPKKTVGDA
jgi:hypothetical protein